MADTGVLPDIITTLEELIAMLQVEGHLHRFRGLAVALEHARLALTDSGAVAPLRSTITSLFGGMGKLDDYVITRGDRAEMIRLNEKFDSLRTRLSELVQTL